MEITEETPESDRRIPDFISFVSKKETPETPTNPPPMKHPKIPLLALKEIGAISQSE